MMRTIRSFCGGSRLAIAALGILVLGAGAPAAAQDPLPAVAATPDRPPVAVPIVATWSDADVAALRSAIRDADREGLDPARYDATALEGAAAGAARDRLCDQAAMMLARDYLLGRVSDREDQDWHVARSPYEAMNLPAALQKARADGRLDAFLAGLLPQDERYAALRDALAATDPADTARRAAIRANMERWRWLPRDLGRNYLYVNVPSYKLAVVDDGATLAEYTVVVGAPDTPTPILSGPAGSLVVNPTWTVPQSIIKKGFRGGRGFTASRNPDGSLMLRQAAGPGNALGRIKINVANDQAIYLHDTNAKRGFARQERALSHGCIRVKDIAQLAEQLMTDDGGAATRLDDALATTQTRTLALPRQWQVWLVYFTIDRGPDGGLVTLGDPYGRDAKLVARLDGEATAPVQMAMR